MTQLSEKELSFIQELLSDEDLLVKKYQMLAEQATDEKLKFKMLEISYKSCAITFRLRKVHVFLPFLFSLCSSPSANGTRSVEMLEIKKKKRKRILSWYFRSKQRQKVPRDLMGRPLLDDFQLNFYRPMRLG